jgi:hypothetical protein
MAELPHITRFGLPGVDRVPAGMHACHFYSDPDQLVAALVPYFIAGLRARERCLWLAAPPVPAREGVQALRAAWDGIDALMQEGVLRILDSARLKGLDVVQLCLDEEERALSGGYSGLRIAGNAGFLEPSGWAALMTAERAMTARFHGRRIVALCSYMQCDDRQMSEVMQAHDCALKHSDGDHCLSVIPRRLAQARHDNLDRAGTP